VNLVNQQDKLVSIYQAVLPGVVTVQTTNDLGSGIVYNSDGIIVTMPTWWAARRRWKWTSRMAPRFMEM